MKIFTLVSSFLLVSTSLAAQTGVEDVESFTLENGMKFLVLEDHSIPNANMYMFWRVGSRNEYPGITGLSHFFEHMMFNGAKKYGPKEFDRVMEANGGSNNAYTSENVTVYTDWFPSSAMEIMFDLEADRIGNLAIDSAMVESERGVVLSERTTSLENSNFYFLYEQVIAVAFMAHPYRWSVLGYESDIKNWRKGDLERYFETYYAPNNCLVVMVGDLSADEVRSLAKEYLEPIPPHDPPRPVHVVEPEQLGEKRLVVHKDVSTPHLLMAYHVPESASPDYYAVDVLNSLLSEGNSSRLYSALVDEKQLAISVETEFPLAFDPTLLLIYAVAAKDVHAADLEAAIDEELDRIVADGTTAQELEKVKNRRLVQFYRNMETINGRANTIGTYEVFFGDYRKLFSAPDEYRRVTEEDVKRVADQYLKKSNRTVGILTRSEEGSS